MAEKQSVSTSASSVKRSYALNIRPFGNFPGYRIVLLLVLLVTTLTAYANPTEPQDFRYEVYSSSTLELFWSRSTDFPPVVGYELTKDGEVLGVFDALSHIDNGLLEGGGPHLYTLAAVDNQGRRSEPVSLSVRLELSPDEQITVLQQEIDDLREQLSQSISAEFPGPVAATGETESFQFGDDGDYQAGVAVSGQRFQDNDDGTFLDRLTGLTWLGVRNCIIRMSWTQAVTYSNSLADDGVSCSALTDGSEAGDWRLANLKELQSLMDVSRDFPVLAEGIPYRGNWSENPWTGYWSSSSFAPAPHLRGWSVNLEFGSTGHSDKSNNFYAWSVKR